MNGVCPTRYDWSTGVPRPLATALPAQLPAWLPWALLLALLVA